MLSLTVDPSAAAPAQDIDLLLVHRDRSQFEYGLAYDLERHDGDSWSTYDICEGAPCAFEDIAGVADGESRQTISAPSRAGVYRVSKTVPGLGTASAVFQVVDTSG